MSLLRTMSFPSEYSRRYNGPYYIGRTTRQQRTNKKKNSKAFRWAKGIDRIKQVVRTHRRRNNITKADK